jgi:hypothetical protein
MLRTVSASRYVTPLREGGSLPAIVEADDLGLYVLKFRGAGQGPLALVAELIAGELGRHLGLPVPEIVLMEFDAALGRNEPDYEIRTLLQASVGLNLALDYLPGSTMFEAAANSAPARIASQAVWFDAFILNVDRTPRNPNLLYWHKTLYLIDHGAALYFHHNWQTADQLAVSPFGASRQHVLLPWASEIAHAGEEMEACLNRQVFEQILAEVPDDWLLHNDKTATATERRAAYVDFLSQRLGASAVFTQEAMRIRAELV